MAVGALEACATIGGLGKKAKGASHKRNNLEDSFVFTAAEETLLLDPLSLDDLDPDDDEDDGSPLSPFILE